MAAASAATLVSLPLLAAVVIGVVPALLAQDAAITAAVMRKRRRMGDLRQNMAAKLRRNAVKRNQRRCDCKFLSDQLGSHTRCPRSDADRRCKVSTRLQN